jgi:hypothetical protein
MWNLSTIPLHPHHPYSNRNPPPAPHIRSSGPNNRAITNPASLCSSRSKGIEREISLIKKEPVSKLLISIAVVLLLCLSFGVQSRTYDEVMA